MKKQYYKYGKRMFRYDFDNAIAELVVKADKQMLEDNKEWQAKWGKDLWDIDEDGYMVMQEIGFSRADWKSKADRDSCLEMWCYDMDIEAKYLAEEFIKNELPLYI